MYTSLYSKKEETLGFVLVFGGNDRVDGFSCFWRKQLLDVVRFKTVECDHVLLADGFYSFVFL